jgi:SSS family solute:Na+ symporter
LNCSATVALLDFYKRYFNSEINDRASVTFLRVATAVWGLLGTAFALLMIRARSALDLWWQISGIFGGGILGLFILSLLRVRPRLWQALVSVAVSIAVMAWATFARNLPAPWRWAQCSLDDIIIGAAGTAALILTASLISRIKTA